MRSHNEIKRQVVREWLAKADADLELAEYLLSEKSFPNGIAFHSQQAVEKYLKALLCWHQVPFPKTHDLEYLLDLVDTVGADLAKSLRDVSVLTPYGVELRYPGDRPDATDEEATEAVTLACRVRTAIMEHLRNVL